MNVNELTRGEVLQRIMLNSRQSVYVLRIGGRVMVVGTGSQDAPQLLSEWPFEDTTGDQSAETDDLSDQELPRIIGREESVA
jgi:flagellar biogenesis protein FliO